MLCVACGQDNPDGSKYCAKCNALLPQMAPTGPPGGESLLELDENTEYPRPVGRYVSEVMHALTWAAHEFLEEDGELEPLLDSVDEVRQRFTEFKESIPTILENLADQQANLPEDPYPKQMRYLNTRGVQLYEEGLTLVDRFLTDLEGDSAEAETLVDGINKILDGNDHLCLCIELTAIRVHVIQRELEKIEVEENKAELAEAMAATGGEGAPQDEPTAVPVDSTDVG
ncbi:MAG: zinc ribbon domain-containing protein [Armatimonadetes bacterium]|nr:zinc ribbon domain-containing protein [Armatimonadota bacterium]